MTRCTQMDVSSAHAKQPVRPPSGARQPDYELILESISEGVHRLDADGRITRVNGAASAILGWTAEDLVGGSHHALIHHTCSDGTASPAFACPILTAIRNACVVSQDNDVFWKRDGTACPVAYVATPIRRDGVTVGVVVAFRDVTEQQAAAWRLERERNRRSRSRVVSRELERVFMQVPAAICTTRGRHHVIQTANDRYHQLMGLGDLVGRGVRDVLPPSSAEPAILDRVYATGTAESRFEARRVWNRGGGAQRRASSMSSIKRCGMPAATCMACCRISPT